MCRWFHLIFITTISPKVFVWRRQYDNRRVFENCCNRQIPQEIGYNKDEIGVKLQNTEAGSSRGQARFCRYQRAALDQRRQNTQRKL